MLPCAWAGARKARYVPREENPHASGSSAELAGACAGSRAPPRAPSPWSTRNGLTAATRPTRGAHCVTCAALRAAAKQRVIQAASERPLGAACQ